MNTFDAFASSKGLARIVNRQNRREAWQDALRRRGGFWGSLARLPKCALPFLIGLCSLTAQADNDSTANGLQQDSMTLQDLHDSHPYSLRIDGRVYRYIAFDILNGQLSFADMCDGLYWNEIFFHDLIARMSLKRIFGIEGLPESCRVWIRDVCFISHNRLVSMEDFLVFYSAQTGERIFYATNGVRWNSDKVADVRIEKLKDHPCRREFEWLSVWRGSIGWKESEKGVFWSSCETTEAGTKHAVKVRFSPYGALESGAPADSEGVPAPDSPTDAAKPTAP